jgi:hypothetical protein
MDILLETLGGLVWLLIGVLGMVAFSSAAREGAGLYDDPSPPPKPQRVRVLDPAEVRVIEAAKRLLTEIRPADAWITRELEAISPVAKRCVGQEGADSIRSHNIT